MAPNSGLILLMFAVPLVGWIVARIVVGRAGSVVKAIGDQAMAEWHGTYYAFNDRQVRIYDEDARLWFVAIDVARAVGWKTLPQSFMTTHADRLHRVPGTPLKALDMEGMDLLLARRRDREAGRLLRWAKTEVEAPWRKRQLG
jgi:prophage antirepressor-like protein